MKHSKLSKRIALALKIYHDKNLRNLQGTDESSDSEAGNNSTEPGPPETTPVDDPPKEVNQTIPVSTKGYPSNNKRASIQINKFYNSHIEPARPKLFRYNTLFSFLNVIIDKTKT